MKKRVLENWELEEVRKECEREDRERWEEVDDSEDSWETRFARALSHEQGEE